MEWLLRIALLTFMASSAIAADKNQQGKIALPWDSQPAAVAVDYKVHNFEVGALLGYGWSDHEQADPWKDGQWGAYVGYLMRPNQTLGLGMEVDATRPFDSGEEWLLSLRLRAGIYVTPQMFAYGTGGAVWSLDTHETGWVAGGGLSFEIARNVAVKVEYLHYELDISGDLTQDVVRTGLAFKF
jgi:opacity protein-like surface antigen